MKFAAALSRVSSLIFCLALGPASLSTQAPPKEWVWLGLDDGGAVPQPGNPAVLGQTGFYDSPPLGYPGGREGAASWTDSSGNLWIFGGSGFDGFSTFSLLNDLWEFTPSTQTWTWVGGPDSATCSSCAHPGTDSGQVGQPGAYGALGSPSAGNTPGGRYFSQSWTDSKGNFWLFGGLGFDSNDKFGVLGDLWEFDPSTREWTWVGGSNLANPATVTGIQGTPASLNTPGARAQAFVWTDGNGNIWIFAGTGVPGYEDDLWQLNSTTHEWTYEGKGDGTGSYGGGFGPPGGVIFPGTRTVGTAWTDTSGNLWLFGGIGYDSQSQWGGLNDLWELNPTSLQWTWVGGSAFADQPGVMGTLGVPDAQNVPAGRGGQTSWTDKSGNIWILGGDSYYTSSSNGVVSYPLNDLWEWNPSLKEWTWMGGSSSPPGYFDKNVAYGTLGVSSAASFPAGRVYANGWTDSYGTLWLFGGEAGQSNGTAYYLDDIWAFGVPAPQPQFSLATGKLYSAPQSLAITDSNPEAQIYYTTDGVAPSIICGCFVPPTLYSSPVTLNYTTTVDAIAIAPGFINSALASATYDLPVAPEIIVQPNSNSINSSQVLPVTVSLNLLNSYLVPVPPYESSYGTMTLIGGGYNSGPVPVPNFAMIDFNIPAGALAKGQDTLTATYTPNAGDSAYFLGGTGSAPVTVIQAIPTTTTLAATANPQEVGGVVDFVMTVVPASGPAAAIYQAVIFLGLDGGPPSVGYPLDSNGRAEFGMASLTPGVHAITATFQAQGNFGPSSSTLQEIISTAPASIATVSGSGQSTPYGREFTQPLVAVEKDSHGYLVPGAVVTSNGAGLRFSSSTAITDANGRATVHAYPTAAGNLTATAAVSGAGTAASFSLSATRPTLLVKANNTTFAYGQPIPAPTYSLYGFVNQDTAATAVTGSALISSPARQGSLPGVYGIGLVQGTLSAPNYNLVFEQGTVTITP